jgi:hypothetical protein
MGRHSRTPSPSAPLHGLAASLVAILALLAAVTGGSGVAVATPITIAPADLRFRPAPERAASGSSGAVLQGLPGRLQDPTRTQRTELASSGIPVTTGIGLGIISALAGLATLLAVRRISRDRG